MKSDDEWEEEVNLVRAQCTPEELETFNELVNAANDVRRLPDEDTQDILGE